MAADDSNWRTQAFRQSVVAKIDEAIQRSGMPTSKNSIEMENHVFQKAKTKEEYLGFVARLILHVREMNSKKAGMQGGPNQGGPGMPDPINALQNLASQGTRNNQMMGNPNNPMSSQPNALGSQNANAQITATNLLQTLNQRPGLSGMPNMQNKMPPGMGGPGMGPGMGNQGPPMGGMGGPMGQMSNQTMANMQQQMQNQMQGQLGNQMGSQMTNQMLSQLSNQMNNPNSMNPNNMGMNMGQNNMGGPNMNQGMVGPNMAQSQMMGPNSMGPGNMNPNNMNCGPNMGNMQGPNMGQGGNMGPGNMGPGNMGPGNMGPGNMGPGGMGPGNMGQVNMGQSNQMVGGPNNPMNHNMGGPNNPMGPLGPGPGMPGQMLPQHMQRKPGEGPPMMMNNPNMFQGNRNVGPNQFLRQSPSPSAPSPAGMGGQGGPGSVQMVPSPALVPSPSPQMSMMSQQQRSVGMAPSPSSSLNTPGQSGPTPSPLGAQEDQAYREKARQLSKYIEPLRRMIARMGNDDVEKLSKMKKLLEILSNPSRRIPLETLLKCEVVLEKLDLKRSESSSSSLPVQSQLGALKENHIFNPLLEAVNTCLQSPTGNHTLYRTFGPTMASLFGPEIKNMPPPLKQKRIEEPAPDISDVLQGEIARLDQRFKVSLDPTQQPGSKSVQLLCWLDDRYLPSVPPVSLWVPENYPDSSPHCSMSEHEYNATSFLISVQKALQARITKLPKRFSVSLLLDTWEMSVRQASAPTQTPPTSATVLMGL